MQNVFSISNRQVVFLTNNVKTFTLLSFFKKNSLQQKTKVLYFLQLKKPLNALTKDKGCLTNGVRELSVGARQSSSKRFIPFEAE